MCRSSRRNLSSRFKIQKVVKGFNALELGFWFCWLGAISSKSAASMVLSLSGSGLHNPSPQKIQVSQPDKKLVDSPEPLRFARAPGSREAVRDT